MEGIVNRLPPVTATVSEYTSTGVCKSASRPVDVYEVMDEIQARREDGKRSSCFVMVHLDDLPEHVDVQQLIQDAGEVGIGVGVRTQNPDSIGDLDSMRDLRA